MPPDPKPPTVEELVREAHARTIQIRFDGPPSHESGRFVEVEDTNGASISLGDWVQEGNYWLLKIQIPSIDALAARVRELETEIARMIDERAALQSLYDARHAIKEHPVGSVNAEQPKRKKFADLRAKMSPEAQERARHETSALLVEMILAAEIERDEARGESVTRKRIIEQQNTERLAIVEEAQRNDLARREQAETLEAENARLRDQRDAWKDRAEAHHSTDIGLITCVKCNPLREGREGKG